jgi:site-specific recombinase XerD
MSIDREKYMSMEEVKTLRAVTQAQSAMDLRAGRVNGVLAWMVVDIALSTGLRVSEIANLNVEDIDLKRGCLKVVRVKKKRKTKETLAVGKELVDHLNQFLKWRSARISSADKGYRKGLTPSKGPLFIGCRGPLTSGGLQKIWHGAVERANLPKELSIHSARHTMAVHLLKRTGNLRQVQKQLGHSSPATTANLYADVPFEDMQNGVTGLYAG